MESGPNPYRIGNGTCYIPKLCKFYVAKRYLCQQAWKSNLWHVSVHFTDRNTMQIGDLMELNLEVLEMQKLNISVDRAE